MEISRRPFDFNSKLTIIFLTKAIDAGPETTAVGRKK